MTRTHSHLSLLLGAVSALASLPVAAEPGDLDVSFGIGGIVTTAFGSGNDRGYSLVLQSDGKIVVAGQAAAADFAVARYNPDGTLDTTFNGTGKVTTNIRGTDDNGRGVALQSDGKIVVVGSSSDGGNRSDVTLVRYNTDGTLDTSFGQAGTGKIVTTIAGGSSAGSVAVQADGKIVVAGDAIYSTLDFVVLRYNGDGTLDNSFGVGGLMSTDLSGTHDVMNGMVLQGDGKIVVSGYDSGSRFRVARYNPNG
ncbi:MAG: hypothetical protein U1A53_23535, partial [Prosthecobacter sp.]